MSVRQSLKDENLMYAFGVLIFKTVHKLRSLRRPAAL